MSPRLGYLTRSAEYVVLSLTLIVATALSSDAQQISPTRDGSAAISPGVQQVDAYRLTMPVLRKVMAGWPKVREGRPDGWTDKLRFMNVKQLTAEFDRIPAARRSIASSGLSTQEYAAAWLAYTEAAMFLMEEDLAKTYGTQPPAALKEGIRKQNVELIRANRPEIEQHSGP
jgi:hypothetical protein